MNREIADIADIIKNCVKCERIYLFGSHAYGTPVGDSDYDLYLIIPDNSIRPIEAVKRAYGGLARKKMNTPVDILALNESRFRARRYADP